LARITPSFISGSLLIGGDESLSMLPRKKTDTKEFKDEIPDQVGMTERNKRGIATHFFEMFAMTNQETVERQDSETRTE